jgi:hypothetical protein
MSANPAPPKHRVQLDFSAEALDKLNRLMAKIDAASRAEVVRHAFGLLDWMVDRLREGDKIMLRTPAGELETVHFPWVKEPVGAQSATVRSPQNGAVPPSTPRQPKQSSPRSVAAARQQRRSNK